ncbi:MAG: hypothetical protein JNL58_22775 [Planctomyces sp.]|nr:hypothetical protein [Planctomyces sp.]
MPKNLLVISALLVIMISNTGCSKFRWLSRNDYSEMHDPFMDSDTAVADSPPRAGDGAGRARLDAADPGTVSMANSLSPQTGTQASTRLSGPKPIQQTAATEDGRSRVAQATYPSAAPAPTSGETRSAALPGSTRRSGPSLADFMTPSSSQPGVSGSTASPATTANAVSTSSDHEGDPAFMEWAANQPPANQVPVNQSPIVRQPVAAAGSSAQSNPFSNLSSASRLAPQASPDFDDQPFVGDDSSDIAEPLIPSSTTVSRVPASNVSMPAGQSPFAALEAASTPASAVPQPESNPFGETIRPARPVSGTALDSDFMRDTGWKPSALTRP